MNRITSRVPLWRAYAAGALGAAALAAVVMAPEVKAAAAALVNVVNTIANPVPTRAADHPALNTWGMRIFPSASGVTINVPPDKYLVIDQFVGFTNSSQTYHYAVGFTGNGVGQARLFPLEATRKGLWFYTRPETSRIVADPGTQVTVYFESTASPDFGGQNVDIAGYYVAKP